MKARITDPRNGTVLAEFEIPAPINKLDVELEWELQDDIAVLYKLMGLDFTNEHMRICADAWNRSFKNLREK